MLMDADAGEGGVKNHPKSADVVYEGLLEEYRIDVITTRGSIFQDGFLDGIQFKIG